MSWYPDLEGIALAQQINWPPVQSNEYVWMVHVQNISSGFFSSKHTCKSFIYNAHYKATIKILVST